MKVCVVGAGVSGLTAVKHCLEYGLEVVCFEAGQHVGGLWRYNTEDRNGFGSVMRNTILNTSKEFIAFSDFAIDEKMANFPHNREVIGYLEKYADNFGLKEHIQLETRVIEINKSTDYEETGNWLVSTERADQSGVEISVFNAVIVSNGHHVKPSRPNIPDLEFFKGTVIHSHEYMDHRPFHDRRVLVVGFGNSGGDVACELARVSKRVTVSTRQGTWVTRRVVSQGYPRDVILRTRYFEKAMRTLPKRVRQWLAMYEYTSFMDHEKYGLRPREMPGESPVLLADDLPLHLSSGAIRIRGGIEKFEENSVVFSDGSREEVDDVVLCTGYDFDFDFLEGGQLIPVEDNQVRLWKRMFVPEEQHHTLAIVGLVDPLGPTMTMAEIQSRAVAHIWSLKVQLPSKGQMNQEIDEEKKATTARFKCSGRKASLQIDHIAYFDAMANIIGCPPPLDLSLFVYDPALAFLLHFGPVTASHYRIVGPHQWKEAGKHVKETFQRVHKGMNPYALTVPGTPHSVLLLNNPTKIMLAGLFLLLVILITLF